jgi:transcription elongation factor GreA
MERVPVTPDGLRKMKEEYDRFLKVERPTNIKAIEEARAHGDLSENAEYHAAKERHAHIEARIRELESKISRAQVIDPSKINHDRIAFGATVRLLDLDSDDEVSYMIVGTEEADVKNGRISLSSPVGKALLGKCVGDEVTIKAPARTLQYEVVSIAYEAPES